MSLYFKILIFSFIVPLLYSFEPKVQFYKKWKLLFISIFMVMIPYIIWDVYFTQQGYWGFTEQYISDISLLGLPVEEILFFVVIPYACAFTFYALKYYFPNFRVPIKISQIIGYSLVAISVLLIGIFYKRPYTTVNFLFVIVVLIITLRYKIGILQVFLWVFPIILIPFFIVNGILTGFGIQNEVVWYNPKVFMGFRMITIPLEDMFYAFSLILANLVTMDFLQKKFKIWKRINLSDNTKTS